MILSFINIRKVPWETLRTEGSFDPYSVSPARPKRYMTYINTMYAIRSQD